MISKINSNIPAASKFIKNPKTKIAAATAVVGLSVLSTRQAWPYCLGSGTPTNNAAEHPEDYELRLVNGVEIYVRKDIPVEHCPRVEDDIPEINIDAESTNFDIPSAHDFIFHPIDSTADVIEHVVDKTQTAFDHVKDFFENLGH